MSTASAAKGVTTEGAKTVANRAGTQATEGGRLALLANYGRRAPSRRSRRHSSTRC